jgi:prepilin-type N-terminal cleavage/methylation domain-containing protein
LNKKGFTLIELLVVIVIIGILVAIALPNFIKIKDKAREAEVKQNLHSIQLAVERYATDMDGNYPYFLYGGDTRFNIGTHIGVRDHYYWNMRQDERRNPFDMFYMASLANLNPPRWCYARINDWTELRDNNLEAGFGDTLAYEGYLPKFPGNPFVQGKASQMYGIDFMDATDPGVNGMAGFGGYDGTCMWNTSQYGDYFMIHKFVASPEDKIIMDLPGMFQYHPRWTDAVTNMGHLFKQADTITQTGGFTTMSVYETGYMTGPQVHIVNSPEGDAADVSSLDVMAYDLTATGSPRTKGQDLDQSVGFDGAAGYFNSFRSGYLTQGQERNPFMSANQPPYNVAADYMERPFSDSIPDFYIIHLSSGIDKKMQNDMAK